MFTFGVILVALFQQSVHSVSSNCGDPFRNGVGPYDYNSMEARNNPSKIPIVEAYHFTNKVEQLIEGESSVDPGGDIDYVLRAVPNHHRALYAISKYELQNGRQSMQWRSVECYFERAIRFNSDDGVVYLLFGLHYAIRNQHARAIEKYMLAEQKMPESVELHYNMGLSLFEIGRYDEALKAAQKAYDGGYPLPGLRSKLKRRGYEF